MCKVLKVSSSGYYYWRKHPVGARQLKQRQLLADIRQVHPQSQGRYGLATFDWRRFLGTFGDKPEGTHEEKACI